MNKALRKWFAGQAVRATTTTEGDAPQQNGTAERAIRRLRNRCRTNLRAAGFPPELWPCPMCASAAQQRAEALGFTSKLAAPFGARCLVKAKAAAKGEISESWISGRYAGLSPTVDDGHLVYRDDGKGNGFAQTLHVRTSTLEPPECRDRFEPEADYMATPLTTRGDILKTIRDYHTAVIRPELYNMVTQIEQVIGRLDDRMLR